MSKNKSPGLTGLDKLKGAGEVTVILGGVKKDRFKKIDLDLSCPESISVAIESLKKLNDGESTKILVNEGIIYLSRQGGELMVERIKVTLNGSEMKVVYEILEKGNDR